MLLLAMFLLSEVVSCARKFSISTNLLGYAEFGTLNLDASYAVSRRWNITAGVRYNPFTFRQGTSEQFQYRQRSFSVGARLWPWHTWSGWWFAAKLRYQEYNYGGIISEQSEEGDRWGGGLYTGYTYMLAPWLNIEFGAGFWTGAGKFVKYSCPSCGVTEKMGNKFFFLPDDFVISLVYVF